MAKYYADKLGLDLNIKSAGFINAFSYMQPESKDYLNSKHIDSSDFRPRLIKRELLEKQDLIITMERSHSIDIIRNFPQINDIDKKTLTLKEFNGDTNDPDIIDPYYTNYSVYKKVLRIIDENVESLIKKITKRN